VQTTDKSAGAPEQDAEAEGSEAGRELPPHLAALFLSNWNEVPDEPDQVVRQYGKYSAKLAGELSPDISEPGLIDGILETKGLTIVYGPSGSGKTAAVVDKACHIACGLPWRGHHTKRGAVVYFAVENPESTERRVWAWQQRHGMSDREWSRRYGIGRVPLVVVQTPLTLTPAEVMDITLAVREIEADLGLPVVLVILDTLARSFTGNENDAADMGAYVNAAMAIKDVTNGHVLIVHHTGKDEARGARGSSALKAATDHELEVFRYPDNKTRGIHISKVREGDSEGKVFAFTLDKVHVGCNDVEREVNTIVAVPCEAPARTKGDGKKAPGTDLERCCAVLEEHGAMSLAALKKKLRLREGDSTNRGAWKRLLDGERGAKLIVRDDGTVHLEDQE
jgi:hypothetical protein